MHSTWQITTERCVILGFHTGGACVRLADPLHEQPEKVPNVTGCSVTNRVSLSLSLSPSTYEIN